MPFQNEVFVHHLINDDILQLLIILNQRLVEKKKNILNKIDVIRLSKNTCEYYLTDGWTLN